MKIYIDTKKGLTPMPELKFGILVGTDNNEKIKFIALGKATFDQFVDITISALHEIARQFNEETRGEMKPEIHKRLVQAFSLMIDHFYPEAKESAFEKLTEEAIIKAQNEILKNKQTGSTVSPVRS